MSKIRPHFMLAILIAMLLLTAFAIPVTAQGNPTKTPKPTNTVRPSATRKPTVTPKPSITPIGFVPIPTRADDFGGGGTILYMNMAAIRVMDASGKNDRVALSTGGSTSAQSKFLGDANTIMFTDFFKDVDSIYLTNLKGRKPEKLPDSEGARFYLLSPDRTQFIFELSAPDSGKISLVAYDIAAKQQKELTKFLPDV